MGGRWGEMPFAALTLSFAAGIGASFLVTRYTFGGMAAGTAILTSAALLALRRERLNLAASLSLAGVALGGMMLALSQRDAYPEQGLRAAVARNAIPLGEPVAFDGCVAEEVERNGAEQLATVQLHAYRERDSWIPCRGKALLRIPGTIPGEEPLPATRLQYGDRVRGWAAWQRPGNFQNPGSGDYRGFLLRRGIILLGRAKSPRLVEVIPGDCANPWWNLPSGIRRRLRASLDTLAREGKQRQASILASILMGDRSEPDNATREAFQNSGTYHVLVVSGLHVGWIALILIGLSRILRLPRGICRPLVVLGIVFYSCVVGFQASISRALWMFILYLTGQTLLRRAAPANIVLAAGFLLLAANPDWLLEVGFQLSFVSVLAVCLSGLPLVDRHLKPLFEPLRQAGNLRRTFLKNGPPHRRGRRWRLRCELLAEACGDRWNRVCERRLLALFRLAALAAIVTGTMVSLSLAVQLWLEPLLAYHFNRLCWIAPAANLVVVPLAAAVLAAAMISALAALLLPDAGSLFEAARWLAGLLLETAQWISGIPGAWQRCPTPQPFWVLLGLLLLFAWSFLRWRRSFIPGLYVGLLLVSLSTATAPGKLLPDPLRLCGPGTSAMGPDSASALRITFLDVGEGDAMVIRFPDSRVWMLDAGGIRQGAGSAEKGARTFDLGEVVVSRYLWSSWIPGLDRVVLSHPDLDHGGGIPAVLQNFPTGRLNYGEGAEDPLMVGILDVAEEAAIPWQRMRSGDTLAVAGAQVRVLNPPGDEVHRSTNNGSVVLQISFGRFSALLAGDLESMGERELLSRWQGLESRLLKVAHHGSRTGTLDAFLDRVRPCWAVISVGKANSFGHPSQEVLHRLVRHGARLLLTSDLGAVSFETDGTRYILECHVTGVLEAGTLREPAAAKAPP